MITAKNTVSMTSERYSVVLVCCDPPVPARFAHTDAANVADRIYHMLRRGEFDAWRQSGTLGGEWEITLWQHTRLSQVTYRTTHHPVEGSDPFVYLMSFEGSKVLKRCSYMELIEAGSAAGRFVICADRMQSGAPQGFLAYDDTGWHVLSGWEGQCPAQIDLGHYPVFTDRGVALEGFNKHRLSSHSVDAPEVYLWAYHRDMICDADCPALCAREAGPPTCRLRPQVTAVCPGQHHCIVPPETARVLLPVWQDQLLLQQRTVRRIATLAGVDPCKATRLDLNLLTRFEAGERWTCELLNLLAAEDILLLCWVDSEAVIVEYQRERYEIWDAGTGLVVWKGDKDDPDHSQRVSTTGSPVTIEALAAALVNIIKGEEVILPPTEGRVLTPLPDSDGDRNSVATRVISTAREGRTSEHPRKKRGEEAGG